ncbi:MAG TPA: hypothetical protein VMH49_07155, partial [Thermoplasmata archaeon]|nr:hypothetical protein [Thermoplasmata archaeon]
IAGGVAGGAATSPAWHEGAAAEETYSVPTEAPAPEVAPGPSDYLETPPAPAPEPMPAETAPAPAAVGAGAAGEAGEEAEPDIDSLMAELEKISGEILKKSPKKRTGTGGSAAATGGSSGNSAPDDDAP